MPRQGFSGNASDPAKKRPDAEACKQAWEDEEHLLRAHDGSTRARGRLPRKLPQTPRCEVLARGKPAKQKQRPPRKNGSASTSGRISMVFWKNTGWPTSNRPARSPTLRFSKRRPIRPRQEPTGSREEPTSRDRRSENAARFRMKYRRGTKRTTDEACSSTRACDARRNPCRGGVP